MKSIAVELKVKNLTDKIEASQVLAGGIPKLGIEPKVFYLDADNNSNNKEDLEIVQKLFRNVLATYCKAVYNDENWMDHLYRKSVLFNKNI